MKYLKYFLILIAVQFTNAQEIPLSKLLYPTLDFEFKLSASGDYMASIKKSSGAYYIFITDIRKSAVSSQIPLGTDRVYNLNWISDNRISFEQTGLLYAINIDGTEKQQLMSLWKDDKAPSIYSYYFLESLRFSKMVNPLDNDFDHILVETEGIEDYPVLYKLDIFTGDKEEIENGNDNDIDEWLVDRTGKVRFGIQNEDDKIKFFSKNSSGEWESKNELLLDTDGESHINKKIDFLDFAYDDNKIYLASRVDNPRWQVVEFDIVKKAVIDTILNDDKYDIGNPLDSDTELLFLDSEKELIGVRYERDKPYTKWFNKKFADYQDTLKAHYPEYFADIFNWNKDGSVILVKLFSDVDPGHILIYNSETRKHLFFVSFAADLYPYPVSYTKIINYKARDGYELEGYMNLPVDSTRSKFPFVIMPHGGPYARDYWEYDAVTQFFANQGYGVLRMNFRGSTGYGTEHLLQGVKKISTIMIDDIADGVKWIIENGHADSSNIFIYGHSYGGYAALQSLIRYPSFYRAAVSVAAPTNIVELLEYLDDKDYEFSYEFWKTTVGNPGTEEKFLESISPVNSIKKIKNPVFLFHGEKDGIIPSSQTTEFIEEAEDLGIKIDHKIIKDEDHSISENRNKEYILKKSVEFFKENEKK